MSTGKITTRPATQADISGFYGRLPLRSVRAWVMEIDGEAAGIAGWGIEAGHVVVFSDLRDGVPKMTVWRKAKEFMAMIDFPAVCQCTETSGPFLERLGWRHVGGTIYRHDGK